MSVTMPSRTARWIGWPACFMLVFVSAFFLSGTRPSSLELDPSWHAALEYATVHRLQFGTQIVFTFGPLGFLSLRTSLGHLVPARIAFAFFWSALVALTATGLAKRLSGWLRYAFLAWLVVLALSEGLDQTAFLVMAYGALLLLEDNPKQRWQVPIFVIAYIILALIKISFLTAGFASLTLVVVCWIGQRKTLEAISLALGTSGAFVTVWAALGQSPAHLVPWLRHGLELQSGYSAAMNLAPKTPVLCVALATLALFVGVFIATLAWARRDLLSWAKLITIAQYVFLAWKEGFTRSGDWHTFVFLWFLPLGLALCFLEGLSSAPKASRRWGLEATFAACMALCLVAAHFQIPGSAWRQAADWPKRVTYNSKTVIATLQGRAGNLYADSRGAKNNRMLLLDHAEDVIGNESVDVMNYLLSAPVINQMNYRPRPVIQGFVAYTPALQRLNEEYFRSADRPHFIMLCQQTTDGRLPTLEDSGALNYVLNNYVPVAQDGRFLILQQRTAEKLAFQLVNEQTLHFGEKMDLRRWAHRPLFMTATIGPTLLGRAVTLLYQPEPLYMRVAGDQGEERYRVVPSMAERPFLISPLLADNYDVVKLYASFPGKVTEALTFERPAHGSLEFQDRFTVRLYTAPAFLLAARGISAPRIIADVQGRIFWPMPKSVESAVAPRIVIFHGTPALLVRSPSEIAVEVPPNASSFTGYYGVPEEAYTGDPTTQGVKISIRVQDRLGNNRLELERLLQPSPQAGDRGRFTFRVPIDSTRDRTVTLMTASGHAGTGEGGWSVWSQCRFEVSSPTLLSR